jgi:hypothetical protein
MATNDITGDKLTTGESTEQYRSGWDRVFGSKKPAPKQLNESTDPFELELAAPPTVKPIQE